MRLLLLLLLPLALAVEEVYILIDNISVFSCRGIKNQVTLSKDDIRITDEKGNEAYYIKGPGKYKLNFAKIKVLENFPYLSGEISATLQVPIFEGPAGLRFDLPYQVIPEARLLDSTCDELSGVVKRGSRQYCRYCDLCQTTKQVESALNHGNHKYLPDLLRDSQISLAPVCSQIAADSYEFSRTITLPDKATLEAEATKRLSGVSGELKKRLDQARGRFQVFLNLISSSAPPLDRERYLSGSPQCRCCSESGRNGFGCDLLRLVTCSKEYCNALHASQCLRGETKIAACFSVEFNYRLTLDIEEVKSFLKSKGLPFETTPRPTTPKPTTSGETAVLEQKKCVEQIPQRLKHLRNYCSLAWDRKLCCAHCRAVC